MHRALDRRIAVLALACVCGMASVSRAQTVSPDLFKQLDRNSDGKVSREEAGKPRWFDALDADKDGFLSRTEVDAFRRTRDGATPPATAVPTGDKPGSATPSTASDANGFQPDDVRVSPPGRPMVDPEFNDVQHRVAYWDYVGAQLNITVAEIDPQTGLLKSEGGRDFPVAERVAPNFKQGQWYSHNGPEWGRDRDGWAIYFTKEDEAGNRQMWRAVEKNGRYLPEQLTTKPGGHCGALISQSEAAPDTRMLFYINFDKPAEHTVAWSVASRPNDFHPLPDWRGSHSIARIVGEHHIGYAPRDASGVTQVELLDTRTGRRQVLTNEPGDKFDTYGFRAPEFGGELLMMANIDRQRLAIYRDVAKDGSPWQKIAELRLPADSPFKYIYSCEPIAGETGVKGTSYFSLNATRTKGANRGETGRAERDGSIWVFSLGQDPASRVVRRVDEGAASGIQTTRYESESFVGSDEVFIYYERKNPETGRGELCRCRTGIKVASHDRRSESTSAADHSSFQIPSELTKPALEVCLNASDEAAARRFFVEGLGLSERPQPPFSAGGALRMLLFNAGASNIKVRVYQQPPARLPSDLTARNGFRVLTVPVEELNEVTARVKRLGFECGETQQTGETRWAVARNADGTAFELIESKASDAKAAAERQLEIGLVVADLTRAREFFTTVYGCLRRERTGSIHEPRVAELAEEGRQTMNPRLVPLLVLVFDAVSLAQDKAPPVAKNGNRFAEFDKNADGKLAREELPAPKIFDGADADKDGLLTPEEIAAYFRKQQSGTPSPPKPVPEASTPPASVPVAKVDIVATLTCPMRTS
jgi:catechol 2,3-dioxygenase-like lactoylglutathione lyase family enzyme